MSESLRTIKTLALAAMVVGVVAITATPICVWISDVDTCEAMTCEILAMRRPLADQSYCEAWFDLYR